MGRIHIDLFCSLDLVAQAPGGGEADQADDGFSYAGWQWPLMDDVVDERIDAGMSGMDALLLGRRTYEFFAGFWPSPEDEVARLFNGAHKYVASRGTPQLTWEESTRIGADLATEVRELRDRHEKVYVSGSLDLVQTLLAEGLYDQLTLFVHPLVLGAGKKVFQGGALPTGLRLVEPAITSPKGAVVLRYEPTGRPPETGVMPS
ncbi:deaminase [Geodermatophilus sp. TF02-6]|uniref:dihydrofolate reductase family protein n=1 Tax=Geodermatophilus sp. TF02-6 TaxID=2250575 RepID=UPI000DEB5398|nr:dihydrofolate reductase family protein [Geodermatophilus sp. TF02-6]RBY76814.1 deaminase [Geodermatophilus sp. TF02-6]